MNPIVTKQLTTFLPLAMAIKIESFDIYTWSRITDKYFHEYRKILNSLNIINFKEIYKIPKISTFQTS